jgi:membrane-associated protein
MELLSTALDLVLHIDRHLADLLVAYGPWIYAILFLIVFMETGFVVTPFLPGDSLLFAAGALAATGGLDVTVLLVSLTAAAILGNIANYHIGRFVGPRVFTHKSRWLKQEHLLRAQQFYDKHGGKTIVISRFLPFLRTFAPFVAGAGRMNYLRFSLYNAAGGTAWVFSFVLLGYYFGTRPWVKQNFGLTIVAIIVISTIPAAVEVWRAWRRKKRAAA